MKHKTPLKLSDLRDDLSGLKKLSVLSWVDIWVAFIQSALTISIFYIHRYAAEAGLALYVDTFFCNRMFIVLHIRL